MEGSPEVRCSLEVGCVQMKGEKVVCSPAVGCSLEVGWE